MNSRLVNLTDIRSPGSYTAPGFAVLMAWSNRLRLGRSSESDSLARLARSSSSAAASSIIVKK
jgi:hypothetical protein